jgi:hypothetical protein
VVSSDAGLQNSCWVSLIECGLISVRVVSGWSSCTEEKDTSERYVDSTRLFARPNAFKTSYCCSARSTRLQTVRAILPLPGSQMERSNMRLDGCSALGRALNVCSLSGSIHLLVSGVILICKLCRRLLSNFNRQL